MRRTLVLAAGVGLLLGLFAPPAAVLAVAPANDMFANATVILTLPYSDTVTIDEATGDGLGVPCGSFGSSDKTVWYSITPTSSGLLRVSESAQFYYQFIVAYRQDGSGTAGLTSVGCATWYYGQSSTVFAVEAGKTYYIQTGSQFSYGATGTETLSLEVVPPPANDQLENAGVISSLPFSDSVNMTAASIQTGEPTPSCAAGQSAGTVWYTFTPSASGSFMATTSTGPYFAAQMAVYTGAGLGSLTEIACLGSWSYNQRLAFRADAGTTYYVQVGPLASGSTGTIGFSFDVTPEPSASFGFNPTDPSIFDTVQFTDYSYDPAQVGFKATAWDLGDGTSAMGCCPTHRYTKDGDYTVKLTVTTYDSRTASTTQVVEVRTHDVAITKFTVPTSASAGQTRPVSVGISDLRYPERVQVQLFRSNATGGFDLVGALTQDVPVRGANRTTPFSFNYLFTKADATLGKVTFRAEASVQGYRDALPADNVAIALPTKMNK